MRKVLGMALNPDGEGNVVFYDVDLREVRYLLQEFGLQTGRGRKFNDSRVMLLYVLQDGDVAIDVVAQVEAKFRSRGYAVGPR